MANSTDSDTAVDNSTGTDTAVNNNTTTLKHDPESESRPEKKLKTTDDESCIDDHEMISASADPVPVPVDYYVDHFDSESDSPPDDDDEDKRKEVMANYYYDESTTDDDEDDESSRKYHKMTNDEYSRYCYQVQQSKGFDVESYGNVCKMGMIIPVPDLKYDYDIYKKFTLLAINRYNKKKNKNIQFEEIVKLNKQASAPFTYYITFQAKDDDGLIKTYQTIVDRGFTEEKTTVDYFKLKPGQ